MASFTIGEVSRRTGLASSAIRYYEREGLIPKAPKEGGRRVYDPEILDRLSVIDVAKRAGLTIRETKQLLSGLAGKRPAAEAWQQLTRDKLEEIEARIESLEQMKHVLEVLMLCDCPTLDDCGRAIRERAEPQPAA
jgi:MerR family redox-sensitive transcriptional activator SoxR